MSLCDLRRCTFPTDPVAQNLVRPQSFTSYANIQSSSSMSCCHLFCESIFKAISCVNRLHTGTVFYMHNAKPYVCIHTHNMPYYIHHCVGNFGFEKQINKYIQHDLSINLLFSFKLLHNCLLLLTISLYLNARTA